LTVAKRNSFKGSLNNGFQPSYLPPNLLGFSDSSHSYQKLILEKRKLFCLSQGFNTQPSNYQVNAQPFNQFMFRDNFYKFRVLYFLITLP